MMNLDNLHFKEALFAGVLTGVVVALSLWLVGILTPFSNAGMLGVALASVLSVFVAKHLINRKSN